MKNSKLIKIILVALLSMVLVFVATQVFADDDDGFTDLTTSLNQTDTNNTTDNNTTNNTTTDNNTLDNTTNNTSNDLTSGLTVNNTTNNTTTTSSTYDSSNSMSSSYNNSNLPSTGLNGTTSVMFIVTVLAVSAIYAYKKVSDYKNI